MKVYFACIISLFFGYTATTLYAADTSIDISSSHIEITKPKKRVTFDDALIKLDLQKIRIAMEEAIEKVHQKLDRAQLQYEKYMRSLKGKNVFDAYERQKATGGTKKQQDTIKKLSNTLQALKKQFAEILEILKENV